MSDLAAQGKRNRRHGHETERMVVRYLQARGYPDAQTTRKKLGHDGAKAPGDVEWHPLICQEVKSVANSTWPSWCRQTLAETPAGMVPVVLRRTAGSAYPGLWECRVHQMSWESNVGRWMPLTVCSWVDGESWQHLPFGAFVDMVRVLDYPEDAA